MEVSAPILCLLLLQVAKGSRRCACVNAAALSHPSRSGGRVRPPAHRACHARIPTFLSSIVVQSLFRREAGRAAVRWAVIPPTTIVF